MKSEASQEKEAREWRQPGEERGRQWREANLGLGFLGFTEGEEEDDGY